MVLLVREPDRSTIFYYMPAKRTEWVSGFYCAADKSSHAVLNTLNEPFAHVLTRTSLSRKLHRDINYKSQQLLMGVTLVTSTLLVLLDRATCIIFILSLIAFDYISAPLTDDIVAGRRGEPTELILYWGHRPAPIIQQKYVLPCARVI